MWNHIECVAAAIVGLLLVARRRQWRELAFPAVLLLTAAIIHAIHRPWWPYYYLHLAIPLAWFAAIAVSEAILLASQKLTASRFRLSSSQTWKGVALCSLAALVLVRSERRLEAGVADLHHRPTVAGDPVLAKMKEYAPRTHWVYSQEEIYPFHARLPLPPEIAVVPLKRFWSGQISTREIVELCRKYRPEQLLLKPVTMGNEWKELLSDYFVAYRNEDRVLYLAKRLQP